MKRFQTAGLCAALWLALSPTAHANDTWNGPYFGGKVTYSTGEKEVVGDRFTYNENRSPVLASHDYDGVGFSAFLGHNWTNGAFLYGLEAGLGYANAGSDLTFNTDNDYDRIDYGWTAEVVGRIGVINEQTLLYLKGGIGTAEIFNIGGDTNAAGPDLNDRYLDESFRFGPIGGIGMEQEFDNGLRLRIEGTLADYGDFNQTNNQNQTYRVSNGVVSTVGFGIVIPF